MSKNEKRVDETSIFLQTVQSEWSTSGELKLRHFSAHTITQQEAMDTMAKYLNCDVTDVGSFSPLHPDINRMSTVVVAVQITQTLPVFAEQCRLLLQAGGDPQVHNGEVKLSGASHVPQMNGIIWGTFIYPLRDEHRLFFSIQVFVKLGELLLS
ncbi:hypothetical protein SRHO_G00256420 [Serrasalmus rhombeus]